MHKLGLVCKNKKRFRINTTNSNHDFYVSKPNQVYVGDITYIPTKEDWLYLTVVIDLFSRRVVGWSIDDNMKTSLVNDALLMAINSRKTIQGTIWHTDRSSQYASDSHKQLLKKYGFIQSMSRKENCWDNAVSESFFHTLKTELIYHIKFETNHRPEWQFLVLLKFGITVRDYIHI